MIDLEKKHLEILGSILKEAGVKFYAFGSRAKGNSSKFSDLDLIYKEKIDPKTLNLIKYKLTESDLPFKVDLLSYDDCKKSFIELIEQDLVPLEI